MKTLKTLLVTTLAITIGLVAPRLSAATNSNKDAPPACKVYPKGDANQAGCFWSDSKARAECAVYVDHARKLLADNEWAAVATEAQELMGVADSIQRGSGETEKEHNQMHASIKEHAAKLVAAAGAENRAEATKQLNELAVCLRPNATRENLTMHKAIDNSALADLRAHTGRAEELLTDKQWSALVEETDKIKSAANLILVGGGESANNHTSLHNAIRITADKLAVAANAKNRDQAKKECQHLKAIVDNIQTVQS